MKWAKDHLLNSIMNPISQIKTPLIITIFGDFYIPFAIINTTYPTIFGDSMGNL